MFWSRYAGSGLLREIADKAAYFTKAAAAIYIVREHLVELTVVRPPATTRRRCSARPPTTMLA